jgi:hypothetical protein
MQGGDWRGDIGADPLRPGNLAGMVVAGGVLQLFPLAFVEVVQSQRVGIGFEALLSTKFP